MALRYHPGVNKSRDAENRMKAINETYEWLDNYYEKHMKAS